MKSKFAPKIKGQFIGKIPDEFNKLMEGVIIENLKTKELFQKKKGKWIKI